MGQDYKIRITSSDDESSGICAQICSFLWNKLWPFGPIKLGQQQKNKRRDQILQHMANKKA